MVWCGVVWRCGVAFIVVRVCVCVVVLCVLCVSVSGCCDCCLCWCSGYVCLGVGVGLGYAYVYVMLCVVSVCGLCRVVLFCYVWFRVSYVLVHVAVVCMFMLWHVRLCYVWYC